MQTNLCDIGGRDRREAPDQAYVIHHAMRTLIIITRVERRSKSIQTTLKERNKLRILSNYQFCLIAAFRTLVLVNIYIFFFNYKL